MKRRGCEQEASVMRARHTGAWTSELRAHAAGCADCSEALRVAEALLAQARRAEGLAAIPDAHWIFSRSQRMARERALRRMTLILTGARIAAGVYATGAAVWLLRGTVWGPYRELSSDFHGAAGSYMLLGAALAAAAGLAGLLSMVSTGGRRGEVR